MTATIHAFRTGQAIRQDRIAMRDEVLDRDGCRCAHCRAPGGAEAQYGFCGPREVYVLLDTLEAYDAISGAAQGMVPADAVPIGISTRIVLDVAFRDHDPRNVGRKGRRPNVMVLCQRCARRHDDAAGWGRLKA